MRAHFNINSYDEYLEVMEGEENKKASTKVAMFFEGVGVWLERVILILAYLVDS
jgi:hypothetical protein